LADAGAGMMSGIGRRRGLLGNAWRRMRQTTWVNCRGSEPLL